MEIIGWSLLGTGIVILTTGVIFEFITDEKVDNLPIMNIKPKKDGADTSLSVKF